jgi:hypothetical protein
VVDAARFDPWQAHVIVVDACASVLEADRFVADLDERAPDLDNVAGPAFEAMSRSRSLPDEKRNLRCGIKGHYQLICAL